MSRLPVFITGNQHKADYLAKILGIPLDNHKVDLDEIQSVHLDDVVRHKVMQAYSLLQRPVLVEDVALGFSALNGLPGPFIKFFVDMPDGLERLCRMLDSFEDRSARTECVFGYYDGQEMQLFHGGLDGEISSSPRGDSGFGWDKIFIPEGYGGRTRAELGAADDAASYAAMKPFDQLRSFLEGKG